MPSARRLEYTCDWCARTYTIPGTRLVSDGLIRSSTIWRICNDCTDRLFELRGRETHGMIEQSRALRRPFMGWAL